MIALFHQSIVRSTDKAVLTSNGVWFPKSQIEVEGSFIVSCTPWIYEQKYGRVPTNAMHVLSQREAANLLAPKPIAPAPAPAYVPRVINPNLTLGAYRLNGETFVLRMSRKDRYGKRGMYALHMVAINSTRLMEDDSIARVNFVFDEKAKAAKFELSPEHKLSVTEAEAITIRYRKCLVCGRSLKFSTSVARGIGPVCYKELIKK